MRWGLGAREGLGGSEVQGAAGRGQVRGARIPLPGPSPARGTPPPCHQPRVLPPGGHQHGSVNTHSFQPHCVSWVGLLSEDHILPAAEPGGGWGDTHRVHQGAPLLYLYTRWYMCLLCVCVFTYICAVGLPWLGSPPSFPCLTRVRDPQHLLLPNCRVPTLQMLMDRRRGRAAEGAGTRRQTCCPPGRRL